MKRVLFDENMPRKLRRELPEFAVRTVQEEGWAGLKNGELLRAVTLSSSFDVFVTVDQRLRYQQNIGRLSVGVVVIETFDTTLANLRTMLPQLRAAIEDTAPGTIAVVKPA
jgi:hypothetical protein